MDLRKYFFCVRVVDRWNKLPQKAIDSTSVDVFKNRLQRIRDAQMSFFTDVPAFYYLLGYMVADSSETG